jgi:hypothetical protein
VKVKLQDCGCISLPDELLTRLGVRAGAVFELSYAEESRTMILKAVEGAVVVAGWELGAACPVGTATAGTGK